MQTAVSYVNNGRMKRQALGPNGGERISESVALLKGKNAGPVDIDLTALEAVRGLGSLVGPGKLYEVVKAEIEEYDAQLERVRAEMRAESASNLPQQPRVIVEDIGGTAIMNF